jgi:hypothetical protein
MLTDAGNEIKDNFLSGIAVSTTSPHCSLRLNEVSGNKQVNRALVAP